MDDDDCTDCRYCDDGTCRDCLELARLAGRMAVAECGDVICTVQYDPAFCSRTLHTSAEWSDVLAMGEMPAPQRFLAC